MPKLIGVTGGIGSGKSKVMHYISSLGYPVYLSDEAGKRVMQDEGIMLKIQNIFTEIVIVNGVLDRKKIGSIVFNDKKKLEELNAIVHPAVAEDFQKFVKLHHQSDLIFYESAILIESNNYKSFDYIVLITAPDDVRIERVMKRDQVSKEIVLERMRNQMSDNEKREFADFEIINIDFKKTCEKVNDLLVFMNK